MDMGILIPLAPFIMVLGIVWVSLHYKHLNKTAGTITEDQSAELTQMSKIADILDKRVAVLESILDDEVPNWREK
jgi:phage shock protein B